MRARKSILLQSLTRNITDPKNYRYQNNGISVNMAGTFRSDEYSRILFPCPEFDTRLGSPTEVHLDLLIVN